MPPPDVMTSTSPRTRGSTVSFHCPAWLKRAAERKAWLILFTHGVEAAPTPFGCSAAALTRLLDEAIAAGFEVVTAAEGARRMGAHA